MHTHKIHLLFGAIALISLIFAAAFCIFHNNAFAAVLSQTGPPESGFSDSESAVSSATPSNLIREKGLKTYVEEELEKELLELSACSDPELGYLLSERAYLRICRLYDEADEAYSEGIVEETDYDAALDFIAEDFDLFYEYFLNFGFDPFSNMLMAADYSVGSNTFPRFSLSASYNGSNIIVNFDYRIHSAFDIWWVYMGYSGELYRVRKYNTTGGAAANSYSNFGTVTYTNITSFGSRTIDVTGYITITNLSGFTSWYNSKNHAFWFSTYQSSGGSDVTYECTSQKPITISGVSAAITQASCAHSYVCVSMDSTKHKTYCTKCGIVLNTANHDTSVKDTSSKPGYTLTRCSGCAYIFSTVANATAICTDTVCNHFTVSNP